MKLRKGKTFKQLKHGDGNIPYIYTTKNQTNMQHKLIKTENYLLVVDDSEIKEGNTYIRIDNELLFSSLKGSNPHIVEKYCKKIF